LSSSPPLSIRSWEQRVAVMKLAVEQRKSNVWV
jgi:hypothetical protein